MANTIKVMIDGMEREITLPDYALESTQEKILKALTKGDKTDKESKSALDDLVKGAQNKAKDDKKAQDEADKDRSAQLDALRDINQNVKETGGTGSNLNKFGSAVKLTGRELLSFGGTVLTTVSTGLIALVSNAKGLGDEFGKLQMTGTGLDTAGMSAVNLTTSLNALGLSTESALSVMSEYSGVIQTVGRQAFIDVNKQFANITGSGTRLGLTLDQAADVLADDLELRQQLGMIQDISTNKQAKLSAQLFEQQLQATTVLGKSIDDIRGAAKAALTDNAQVQLAIMAVTANMDADAAAEFTMGLQKAAGDMASVGIDQNIINGVMEAALAPVAFMGPAGAELNKALTALDAAAGSTLRAQIQAANAAKQRGDMDEFNRIMGNFDDEMMKAAAGLDENDLKQLMIQLPALGPAAEKLGLSLGQLRLAAKGAADGTVTALTKSAKAFDNAQSQFGSALNMASNNLSGALGAPMQALADAFSEEISMRNEQGVLLDKNNNKMTYTAEQIEKLGLENVKAGDAIKDATHLTEKQRDELGKTSGIFGVFRDAMTKINDAFRSMFDPVEAGSKGIGNLAQIIASKVNPYIEKFGESVSNFIGSITEEDITNAIDNVVLGLTGMWEAIKFVSSGIKTVLGWLIDTDETTTPKLDEAGNPVLDEAGNVVMESIKKVDIGGTIINGLMGLFALNMAKKAFSVGMEKGMSALSSGAGGLMSKMFGKGGGATGGAVDGALGGTAGNASGGIAKTMDGLGKGIQKFSEGVGKGVKALGEGLGKGLGGLFKGMGAGLTALANPAALLGLAALVLAINGIAFAADLAKDAFEPFGKMVKSILEGVAPVIESFGVSIGSVFEGMGAFVAGIGDSIGNVIAKVTEGIASFKTAGAEAESIKLDAQAAAMERLSAIPTDQILATADAVNALASSMTTFGDAVGSDGMLFDSGADVDKQNEQIGVFAKFAGLDSVAIMNTSDALSAMADSYSKFASLDANTLLEVSRSMESINKATQPSLMEDAQQFVGSALGSVANRLGFGENAVSNPTPDSQALATADQTAQTVASAMTTPEGLTKDGIAIVNKLEDVIKSNEKVINKQTRASQQS